MARRASDPPSPPILVAVLDATALGDAPEARARALFEAGVDWIQLRDRTLEAAALFDLARALVAARDVAARDETARDAGARMGHHPPRRRDGAEGRAVIVNKRCDVALSAGADGVHLGLDAMTIGSARTLLRDLGRDPGGRSAWIGASLHGVDELERALASNAPPDYVHLAPIWSPRSKPAERPALGLETLAAAARVGAAGGVRVIAQGGLDAGRAEAAVEAGAAGVAVTGLLTLVDDPPASARALRAALDRAAWALPQAGGGR
ncbi:MAG: thiamine phosphate synthase [Myxococcota bacterium]